MRTFLILSAVASLLHGEEEDAATKALARPDELLLLET